jgi:hypothetical protein
MLNFGKRGRRTTSPKLFKTDDQERMRRTDVYTRHQPWFGVRGGSPRFRFEERERFDIQRWGREHTFSDVNNESIAFAAMDEVIKSFEYGGSDDGQRNTWDESDDQDHSFGNHHVQPFCMDFMLPRSLTINEASCRMSTSSLGSSAAGRSPFGLSLSRGQRSSSPPSSTAHISAFVVRPVAANPLPMPPPLPLPAMFLSREVQDDPRGSGKGKATGVCRIAEARRAGL